MIKITKTLCIAKLKETDPSLFIDSGKTDRICGNCKKSYKLTDADISTRRPGTYWKHVENAVNILEKECNYI